MKVVGGSGSQGYSTTILRKRLYDSHSSLLIITLLLSLEDGSMKEFQTPIFGSCNSDGKIKMQGEQ